jgi:hypothetical protein
LEFVVAKRLKDIGYIEDDEQDENPQKQANDGKKSSKVSHEPITEIVAPEFEGSKLHSGQLEFLTLVRVISDPDLQGRLWPRLTDDHFAADTSRAVYSRLKTLQVAGREWPKIGTLSIDPALPKAAQAQLGAFIAKAEKGNLAPEITLTNGQKVSVSRPEDFEGHVYDVLDSYRVIRKSWEKVLEATNKIADEQAFDPLRGPEVFELAATEILNLRGKEAVADALMHFGFGITDEDNKKRQREVLKTFATDRQRFKTGFATYDDKAGGIQPGEVVLIGANTGGGKTAFGLSLMTNMARMGTSVAMLQLELTTTQVNERLSANLADTDSELVRSGKLTDKQKKKIIAANDDFHDELRNARSRLTVFAPSSATIQECEYVFKTFPYRVWFIDYINLLKWEGGGKERSGEDWTRLSDIVKEFKRLAKKYGIAIVLAVQVNVDKDSGDIEIRYAKAMKEHADVVLVWNLTQDARNEGVVWMRHLKARQYEPFDFPVRVALNHCRFESVNMALQPKPEERKLGSKKKIKKVDDDKPAEEPADNTFQKKPKPLVVDPEVESDPDIEQLMSAARKKSPLVLDDDYKDLDDD